MSRPGPTADAVGDAAALPLLPSIAPGVAIDAARHPEAATLVTMPAFEGPLGMLLAVIEARQLDVLTVPLGSLAGAYLEALAGLESDRLGSISAFVAVASQLILIKSRALLPRRGPEPAPGIEDEGPDPEAELRARLVLYRAFRDAGTRLQARAAETGRLRHREPWVSRAAGLVGAEPARVEPLDPALLAAALAGIARLAPPPPPPPETMRRTITLTQRATAIRRALDGAPTIVLQELLRGVRDRVVMAVTFLAMLELVKRREIVVEQGAPFGPITARRTTATERAATGIAGTLDDAAPLDESLESFA